MASYRPVTLKHIQMELNGPLQVCYPECIQMEPNGAVYAQEFWWFFENKKSEVLSKERLHWLCGLDCR